MTDVVDSGLIEGAPGADVPVRGASTVMLLRDGMAGLEVFTIRRVAGMAFAGGMTAFPGGGLDPADADPAIPWAGPGAAWWGRQWGVDPDVAHGQVVAAVRELFEETGVLLAGPGGSAAGVGVPSETDRLAVTAHQRSLAEVLRARELPLRSDLLSPWARWITPPGRSRRYDTFFFAAAVPEGQRPAAVTTEASSGQWERPDAVLRAAKDGTVRLLPPTIAMLTDLADLADVAAALSAPRDVAPVAPETLVGGL